MSRKKEDKRICEFLVFVSAALVAMSAFFVSCSDKPPESSGVDLPFYSDNPQFTHSPPSESPAEKPELTSAPEYSQPVVFSERTFIINGNKSKIFMLKIDVTDESVSVVPYLSFNRIFGFETLSDMVSKTGAYAGVNSGFFFEYGRPSGLVVIDGETVSPGSGRYESIIISEGRISFEIIDTSVTLTLGETKINTKNFNIFSDGKSTAVYSGYYGKTDRIDVLRKYIVIDDGRVTSHGVASAPKEIPAQGYVISLPFEYKLPDRVEELDVSVDVYPEFPEGTMAYEGASMLVRAGESLAGDTMPWVGNLNHYDPRTCIGLLEDGSLGLVVIDGRQPEHSTGTTGRETADILIELGFTDAFMLDGGASSSMFFKDSIINNPADMGIARILAGSILVFWD